MKWVALSLLAIGCVDATTEPEVTAQAPRHGIIRVTNVHGEVFDAPVVEEGSRAIYDGDMDLGPFSRTQLRAYVSPVSLGHRWPDNTVRYQFRKRPAGCDGDPTCTCDLVTEASCEDLTTDEKTAIRDAMDEYTRLTGIVFVESSTQPFIALTGWDKTNQSRTFSDDTNTNQGFTRLIAFSDNLLAPGDPDSGYRTIIHELGHGLGFAHEQKRTDRGTALMLFPVCMSETTPFETVQNNTFLSPFDLDSMMMYTSFSFSRGDNGCDATKTTNCCPTLLGNSGTQTTFTYTNNTGATVSVDFEGSTFSISNGASRNFTGHILEQTPDFSQEDLNALHQMYPRLLGSNENGDKLGSNAVQGDFNGDGYRDLAVAAPHEGAWGHPTSGAVFIYRGTHTGLVPWTTIEGDSTGASTEADDRFGAGMAAADLDGDGNDELVVGAPNKRTNGTNRSGGVYIFNTDRAGFTRRDFLFPSNLGFGNGPDDDFGFAIDVAQENGATRILVGSPGVSSDTGRVYVLRYDATAARHNVSGTGTLVSAGHWGDSQTAGNRFGSAIVSGQLDSDANDEIVIGAPGSAGGGKIVVLKGGSSLSQIGTITKPGSDSIFYDESFGRTLELGKFRNLSSGKKQIVVSAPWESTGRVYVLDVTAGATSVSLDASSMIVWPSSVSEFGWDLAVGDLSGDGITDLAVGAPATASSFGAVYLYKGTGATSLASTAIGLQWASYAQPNTHGLSGSDEFGKFVTIGNFDVKGGVVDLAIGAPRKASDSGAIWLYRGSATGAPSQPSSNATFTTFLDQEAQPQK